MELMPISPITEEIKLLMVEARTANAWEINKRLLQTYWHIGRIKALYVFKFLGARASRASDDGFGK